MQPLLTGNKRKRNLQMDKENCEINTAKLDDRLGVFEKFIEDTVTDGLHAMVLALGYRVGIVDAFNRLSRPCTVTEISQEAGLNLR